MANEDRVLFLDVDDVYGADELGLPFRDIVGEGVVSSGDFAVSQRAAGANMSVDVAPGACWIKGDDDANLQPTYRYREPSVQNIAVTAADATNPRKDIVVAEVLDSTFAGVSKLGRVRVIAGTPAGSPAEPAVPNNALKLATIDIPALDTTIGNAQITDRRSRAALGGVGLGEWQTYTPAWVSTGTQPSIGNGTLVGRFMRVGKTVFVVINLVAGSTTTFGTGVYSFSLPVAAKTGVTQFVMGSVLDTGVQWYDGRGIIEGSTTVFPEIEATAGGNLTAWQPTVPFTFANGDKAVVSGVYEAE